VRLVRSDKGQKLKEVSSVTVTGHFTHVLSESYRSELDDVWQLIELGDVMDFLEILR
jgi:hypothetical protein